MYITRAHKQHSSIVTSIPKDVREKLSIKAGDYLVFTINPGNKSVAMGKFQSNKIRGAQKNGSGN